MKNFRKAMHKLEQVFGGTRKTGHVYLSVRTFFRVF